MYASGSSARQTVVTKDRPVDYTFLMFQADRLFEPAKEQYIASLKQGFVDPTRRARRVAEAFGEAA